MSGPNDLLIIGAGELGHRIAKYWREKFPSAEIIGETRTEARHATLESMNVTPIVTGVETRPFPNVVFSVPPGGFSDYGEAVKSATTRVSAGGRFVFTSSTSVYGDVKFANEHTATTNEGRGKRLVEGENAALGFPGGVVVRLAGLYRLEDGGHRYALSQKVISTREESTWNLIHYDDAAEAVVRALLLDEVSERVLLASVEKEQSWGEYIDAVLRHPSFEGFKRPLFLKDGRVTGRKHDNSLTRRVLGWKPKFESFGEFIDEELKKMDKSI